MAAASRQSAVRFIVALGIISLFADVTYEGAQSINGPFLGTLGASAAIVGIVSGAGELAGSSAIGILYGRSLASAVTFAVATQLAAIPLLFMVGRRPT